MDPPGNKDATDGRDRSRVGGAIDGSLSVLVRCC